jgi:PTH1 family peptidyl-tRNA hydrolase
MNQQPKLQKNNPVRLIIGLGNPGFEYAGTRHNVGCMAVNAAVQTLGLQLKSRLFSPYSRAEHTGSEASIVFIIPKTYMNLSGRAVSAAIKRYKTTAEEVIVICDNLDLPPGAVRMKLKGSSGGQRGLKNIIDKVGTTRFARVFVGIGRPDQGETVVNHVLGKPEGHEADFIASAVDRLANILSHFGHLDLVRLQGMVNDV